jgi:hypothetical protein
MRNDTIATREDNRIASEHGAPSSEGSRVAGPSSWDARASSDALTSEAWTGQFPADFSQEELFFMLEVAALFPSEREFVALLGGDAASAWDLELEDDTTSQHPSLEQRTTASVFERLNLASPSASRRKK